jgi:hypothetical protein
VAWTEVGFISDDGVVEARDRDSDQVRAWQGGAIVRTVRASDSRRFTFTFLETNKTTMGLIRSGSTPSTATGVTTTNVKAHTGSDLRAWIIDTNDGAVHTRKIIQRGEVVEQGDIVYRNTEVTAYEVTVECYPASDGTLYTELTDDPAVAVA